MDKNNFIIKQQIESNVSSIRNLLNTGVFSAPVLHPFCEPVFVSVILKLHDLLQKFSQLSSRIAFTDDVADGDITDLVSKIRNAICHLDSPENLLDKQSQLKFVFNMIAGKGTAIDLGGKPLAASQYEDDIAFYYGEHRLYFKRHLIRVISESMGVFRKLYPNERALF